MTDTTPSALFTSDADPLGAAAVAASLRSLRAGLGLGPADDEADLVAELKVCVGGVGWG
jgi:hypothetical protein